MAESISEAEVIGWREQFSSLKSGINLVSHSLGAMPDRAAEGLAEYMRLWREEGINAWQSWVPEVKAHAGRLEKLLDAASDTIVLATNVSQMQSLVASLFNYTKDRNGIVYSDQNFPTVSYVWQAEQARGAQVTVVKSEDGIHPPTEQLLAAINERTLLVPISHVLFRSSAIKDVGALVARAHEVGAYVLLDCYQSAGTVPFSLKDLNVDFACGGSVKWLCGGPGTAYFYVRADLIAKFRPRQTGWFAHEAPFAFTMPAQHYAPGIERYQAGTWAMPAIYQARSGVEILLEVGVGRVREKSLRQTRRILQICEREDYSIRTPQNDTERGGTVCFDFVGAEAVTGKLCAAGYLCDYRPGAGIRVSPHFYTLDGEIERFMDEVARLKSSL